MCSSGRCRRLTRNLYQMSTTLSYKANAFSRAPCTENTTEQSSARLLALEPAHRYLSEEDVSHVKISTCATSWMEQQWNATQCGHLQYRCVQAQIPTTNNKHHEPAASMPHQIGPMQHHIDTAGHRWNGKPVRHRVCQSFDTAATSVRCCRAANHKLVRHSQPLRQAGDVPDSSVRSSWRKAGTPPQPVQRCSAACTKQRTRLTLYRLRPNTWILSTRSGGVEQQSRGAASYQDWPRQVKDRREPVQCAQHHTPPC